MLSWEIYRFFKTVKAATGGVLLKKVFLKTQEKPGKHRKTSVPESLF